MRLPGLRNFLPALLAFTVSFLASSPASAQTSAQTSVQTVSVSAQAARVQADRIAAKADLSARVQLAGHVPMWATASRDQGAVAADTTVSLTLSLSRSPELQAAFDQLLADQQNPGSARYHQWLTPQQVGEQYGPTQNDLDSVTAWLTAQGMHVDNIAPSRIFIHATAPASIVSAVFQTSLHSFTRNARSLMAPTSEPVIPAALAPVVSFIQGLAQVDYRTFSNALAPVPMAQTNIHAPQPAGSPAAARPDFNLTDGTNIYHFLAPADFSTIYDVPSSITGTSQRVAIIGGSRLLASDLTSWESISGLASYQPTYIIPPASSCGTVTSPASTANACSDPGTTSNGDQGEGTLDFERVYGTAPGSSVDQIISTNWLNGTVTYELIQYAIQNNADSVLTMSFGACEAGQTNQFLAYENSLFSQAASQGISVFASSGDSGAAGCEASGGTPAASQSASISDICSSAFVTCVGGTQFSDTANPSTYWSSTNNSTNHGSALSYIPEGAWNEPSYTTSSGTTAYQISATGGGVSTFTAKPSFQVATGVPADGARDVPDISFSASVHNAYFACLAYAKADCTTNITGFGGTSASAPSMAGVAALLNQKLAGRQGNLNPLLYKLYASTPAVFHDATPATSGVSSCTTATASTCNNSDPSPTGLTGGLAGYPLTTGFDLSTGLGSLDVNSFLTAAATTTALASTSTTLTAAPTTITTAQTVVFTAAVASTTSGTPTGTVTFTSNGTPLGSAITLSGGKAVTSSLPFTTAGTYSIVATYSGDSVYAASSNTISFVVTTPVLPTTTTTLVGTASSITTQQTVSYTATITSSGSGTPTGTVQFVRTSSGTATNIGSPVALSGGKAVLPATSFAAGTYTISGIYSGDTNFTGSTSAAVSLTVTAVATTTSISLLTTPTVTAAQSITFTATVAPAAANATAPTGSVQFLVDGTKYGAAVTLSGTTVTSPGITFTVGTHSVSAMYSGDTIFATSTSGFDAVTSTLAPTTIAFTTAPTITNQYATTTFVATVSGLSAAAATTGSVTFKDTTTGITLTNPTIVYSGNTATATLNTAFTTAGNHTISAQFNGDTTTYAASNTASATIAVTATTVILSAATPTLTVTAGASASDIITVTSTNFTGIEALTCGVTYNGTGGVTSAPTCSFNPASVTFTASGTMTATVSVATTAASSAASGGTQARNRTLDLTTLGSASLAALLLLVLPRKSRRAICSARLLSLTLFLAATLTALSGCGSKSSTSTPVPIPGTTKGSYDLLINANSALNQPETSATPAPSSSPSNRPSKIQFTKIETGQIGRWRLSSFVFRPTSQ